MRQGGEHDTVHHSTACRSRIETEMSKDEVLSKNLADIEKRKRGFLARRVEASDKERVDAEKTASGSVNLTESAVCTWIECASDKNTWAELTEEHRSANGGIELAASTLNGPSGETLVHGGHREALYCSPPSWCHPPTTGTKRGCETERPCSLVQGNSITALPSPPTCHDLSLIHI